AADNATDEMSFNLFSDAVFVGYVEKTIIRSADSYTVSGIIIDTWPGEFILSVHKGITMGSIKLRDGSHYQVVYAGGDIHYTREIDDSLYPPEAHSDQQPAVDEALLLAESDDGSIIDVLVVYTPAARSAVGGTTAMETLINLAIDDSNEAYSNSRINPRLNLVHQEEVSYSADNGSFSTTLSHLANPSDGEMDNVHTLRDTYGADMVALISVNSSACGIGYRMTSLSASFATLAFSATRYSCISGNYTFTHELGHNMGCHHAVGDSGLARGGSMLYSYSYGWRFTGDDSNQYRTVMAYSPGTRIKYFSNPKVRYSGTATGVAIGDDDEAYNAGSINNAAETVANWRASVTTSTTTTVFAASGSNILSAAHLVSADVNADGQDDLIYISRKGYCYYTTNLSNWSRVSTKKFTAGAPGDLDGDGDTDDLALITSKGLISYTTDLANITSLGTNAFSVVVSGDFSGSGTAGDIAGINNKGLLKFTTDRSNWQTVGSNLFSAILTADLSSSGRLKDIAGINSKGLIKYTTDLANWQTIGTNKFSRIAVADLTASGTEQDIVAINSKGLIKFTTDRANWQTVGTNKFSDLALGDFSSSSRHKDIVAINLKGLIKYTTDLANWTTIGTNKFTAVVTGDFDDDAATRDDIAAVTRTGSVKYSTDLSNWTTIEAPAEAAN
ncbi:M12 family metallo-peptidase, partial [Thermodesulfobacteriota bacterium]